MFDKTCGILVANYSVFNEVLISKRIPYARHVNEVVIVQYLLLSVTCRVSCGDSVTKCGLTRKDINFKLTYQERPLVAATLLS
jgi:hypothetical protein